VTKLQFSFYSDLVKANEKLYESNNHHSVDLKRFDVDLLTVNSSLVAPDKGAKVEMHFHSGSLNHFP
jgi:hypothetical protein